MDAKMKEYFEKLRYSEIAKEGFYYLELSGLCDAIRIIASGTSGDEDDLRGRLFAINALSISINEKVNSYDFTILSKLLSVYKESAIIEHLSTNKQKD